MLSFSIVGTYLCACTFIFTVLILFIQDLDNLSVIRVLSGVIPVCVMTICAAGGGGDPGIRAVCFGILGADAIALMAPSPHEGRLVSLILSLLGAASMVLVSLSEQINSYYVAACVMVPTLIDIVVKSIQKYSRVRALFKREQVGFNIVDYSSLFYCILLYVLVAVCLFQQAWIPYGCSVAGIVLYIFVHKKSSKGHSIFVRGKRARVVESLLSGSLREPDLLGSAEDTHMNRLYRSVVNYMRNEKPFLDPTLRLDKLASRMTSNRVYLSRTINAFSGVNFNAFVNRYRVEYSIELMNKNPDARVDELAHASGFQTESTYARVFKQIIGETPGAYMRNIKDRRTFG